MSLASKSAPVCATIRATVLIPRPACPLSSQGFKHLNNERMYKDVKNCCLQIMFQMGTLAPCVFLSLSLSLSFKTG